MATTEESSRSMSSSSSQQMFSNSSSGFGNDWGILPSSNGTQDVQVTNDRNEFAVTIDTGDFKPEELKVTTYTANGSDVLKVEGKHVQEEGGSYVSKQISRSYTLPPDCKVFQMTSNLSSGKLSIRVPKEQPKSIEFPASNREIPIQVNKSSVFQGSISSNNVQNGQNSNVRGVPIVQGEPSSVNKEFGLKEDFRRESDVRGESNVRDVRINRSNQASNGFGTTGMRWPFFNDFIEPVQLFNQDLFFENVMDRKEMKNGWNDFPMEKHGQGVETSETDGKFTFSIDIHGYEPKELKVTVLNDVLKIEGKHVSDVEENGHKKSMSKQFVRSYVLPRSVYNMNQVESSLTKAEKLVVTVPKLEAIRHNAAEVNIPIKTALY